MANLWHAECIPCGWLETHDEEEAAIAAAESHIEANHLRVPKDKRTKQHMGHVQMRDTRGIPPPILPVAGEIEAPAISEGKAAELPPPAAPAEKKLE